MISSSRGHVHGGAPAPVAFSSVWSKLSRRLACALDRPSSTARETRAGQPRREEGGRRRGGGSERGWREQDEQRVGAGRDEEADTAEERSLSKCGSVGWAGTVRVTWDLRRFVRELDQGRGAVMGGRRGLVGRSRIVLEQRAPTAPVVIVRSDSEPDLARG